MEVNFQTLSGNKYFGKENLKILKQKRIYSRYFDEEKKIKLNQRLFLNKYY
jgi:hypothetical protein